MVALAHEKKKTNKIESWEITQVPIYGNLT